MKVTSKCDLDRDSLSVVAITSMIALRPQHIFNIDIELVNSILSATGILSIPCTIF